MSRRRTTRGPWTALLVCALVVLGALPLGNVAKATPVDLIHNLPAGWALNSTPFYGSTSTANIANAFDENDSTYASHTLDGGDGCTQRNPFDGHVGSACSFNARVVRSSGVSSFTVGAFRIKSSFVVGCCGSAFYGYEVRIVPEGAGTAQSCKLVYTSTAPDLSGTCDTPLTVVSGDHIELVLVGNWNGGGSVRVYSFEAYASLVTEVGIEFYCHNMRVEHPSFQWVATCDWSVDWEGTLTITTTPSGTLKTNQPGDVGVSHNPSVSYTPTGGFFASGAIEIVQDCYPLCQSDFFTFAIEDTGRSQTASYTFDRTDDGAVQTPTHKPHFTSWTACYNASANQCDPSLDPSHAQSSGAGTTDIAFCWEGSNSNVESGPRSVLNRALFHATPYSQTNQAEGCYTSFGISTPTTGYPYWMFGATNAAGSVTVFSVMNYTGGEATGGTSEPIYVDDDDEAAANCGILQGLCDLWTVATDAIREKVAEAVGDCDGAGNCTGLVGAAMSKQPFNFIVRAIAGLSEQLAAASAAVSATDDCPGYHVELDWASWFPETIWPAGSDRDDVAPFEAYLLKCEDFEFVVSTSWYQAIRTAMDPALIIAYGYAWVRRLQPRPSLNG